MTLRPDEIVRALNRHGVVYVIVGGIAATLHGSPYVTVDIDITPSDDPANAQRLSDALAELQARVRTDATADGLAFQHDGRSLREAQTWNLTTEYGDLDISFHPSGTNGYRDLVRDAVEVVIHGERVRVASLADVIRSKEAAGREKDTVVLPALRRLLDAQRAAPRKRKTGER
jgi:predicted nucleotidyltransferase